MSHRNLRKDPSCLNCGRFVEERFCPHCGQENTESRQPAHYLFTHFIEDFIHYDGQFWKTIKHLLFQPGKLTEEYLAGRRQLYVAPVKLYIFISFITFLLPTFLPKTENQEAVKNKKVNTEKVLEQTQLKPKPQNQEFNNQSGNGLTANNQDHPQKGKEDRNKEFLENVFIKNDTKFLDASDLQEYDSLHKTTGKSAYLYLRPFAKKIFEFKEKSVRRAEIKEKFKETFSHALPKALFFYLPVFALFLWLFHNKKRWWYFDHGIFTLHYFSFLLSGRLFFISIEHISDYIPYSVIRTFFQLFAMAIIVYMFIYFFVAHYRIYETKKRMTILKGLLLFITNCIGILFLLLVLVSISFLMIH